MNYKIWKSQPIKHINKILNYDIKPYKSQPIILNTLTLTHINKSQPIKTFQIKYTTLKYQVSTTIRLYMLTQPVKTF